MKKISKKVILLSSGASRKTYPFYPGFMYFPYCGFYYIAEDLLQNNYKVSIIDQSAMDFSHKEIDIFLNNINSDIVLFNQYYNIRNYVKRLAGICSEKTIIGIGGHDVSLHSTTLSRNDFKEQYSHVDFVWRGEADNSISSFLNNNLNKNTTPSLIDNTTGRIQNLDNLPILPHDNYPGIHGFLVTSRGCYKQGCNFCTTPVFYPDGRRARSLKNVKAEISNLARNKKEVIMITDDNFFGFTDEDYNRSIQIINECSKEKMKIMLLASVDQVIRLGKMNALSEVSKATACVFLGVESGNKGELESLGKKGKYISDSSQSIKAISLLKKHNIIPYLGFINFTPGSTSETLRDNALFLYETDSAYNYFHFYNKLNLFEGTTAYNSSQTQKKSGTSENISEAYPFCDARIAAAYAIITSVTAMTNISDCLLHEIAFFISANSYHDEPEAKSFLDIRKTINEINFKFIDSVITLTERGGNYISVFNEVESFKTKLKEYIYKLTMISTKLSINSDLTYKFPLNNLDMIISYL